MKKLFLLFFTLCLNLSLGQTISGCVTSTKAEPLENTTIIAKPINSKTELKFALSDHLGRYKLELEKEIDYTIIVSYLGYKDQFKMYSYKNPFETHDFILEFEEDIMNEIVINYTQKPIEIKKDTISFNVAMFSSRTEGKLKDQLEKLPGIEITDNGQITFKGKTLTNFMIDGKSFFNGSSKLGLENIPADAIKNIELIDHFTKNAHMKEVNTLDEAVINIKLKEEKKKLIFGDLRTGYGNNHFLEANASLFYFSTKMNWSLLGNINNFGSKILNYQDVINLNQAKSSYLKKNKELINLKNYFQENTDVQANRNQFLTSNFRYSISDNWNVDALVLINKNWIETKSDQSIEYLQPKHTTTEKRLNQTKNKTQLFSGKISTEFNPNKTTSILYSMQFAAMATNKNHDISSKSNIEEKKLNTKTQLNNFSFTQLIEAHKTYNDKHKSTFVFSHALKKETPENLWFSNEAFLKSFVKWNPSEQIFLLNQQKTVNENRINLIGKYYWLATNNSNFYVSLGYNGIFTNLKSTNHLFGNESWQNLASSEFGNHLIYKLNNPFAGIEYKFRYEKFTSRFGVYAHRYQLENINSNSSVNFTKNTIEPEVELKYEFNSTENISFNYNLRNDFLDAENYANQWQVQSFNTLHKGNALLKNIGYQSFKLTYFNFNLHNGLIVYASLNYNKLKNNIRNVVTLDGIDQFYTSKHISRPEKNFSSNASVTFRLKKFEFNVAPNLSLNYYTQFTDATELPSKMASQIISIKVKTLFKENPNLTLHYSKNFSQLSNASNKNFTSNDSFAVEFESKFLKYFLFKTNYNLNITSYNQRKIAIHQLNAAIEIFNNKTNWSVFIHAKNILNTGIKNNVTFNDFIIQQNNTYILPKILMLSVQYKI